MKPRPKFFLSDEHIAHDGEVFDYIAELHGYLWRFVRAVNPSASGIIGDVLDNAIDTLEHQKRS